MKNNIESPKNAFELAVIKTICDLMKVKNPEGIKSTNEL